MPLCPAEPTAERQDASPNLWGKRVAYIHRLPVEILAEIFDFCISDYRPCNAFHYPKEGHNGQELSKQLLSLGASCRGWRDVANNDPSLWCCLVGSFSDVPSIIRMVENLKHFVKRSKGLPLCFYLHQYDMGMQSERTPEPQATLLRLRDFLEQYSTRWHYLQLNLFRKLWPDNTPSHPFPLLTTLSFCSSSRQPSAFHVPPNRFPKLERLRLPYMTEAAMRSFKACWNQLTVIEVDSLLTSELLTILRASPRVVHFSSRHAVGDSEQGGSPSPPTNPLLLRFLRTLDVAHACTTLGVGLGEEDAQGFFSNIRTPNLERLRCSVTFKEPHNGTEPPSSTVLRSFVEESGCNLKLEVVVLLLTSSFSHTECLNPSPNEEYIYQIRTTLPKARVLYEVQAQMTRGDSRALPSLWEGWEYLCNYCHRGVKRTDHRCPANVEVTEYPPLSMDNDI